MSRLPPAWADLPFFAQDWPRIEAALAQETRVILPPEAQRFAALEACAPEEVKVVILGQDPYPTRGHAMGLAFGVTPDTALPRSLKNIFTEMQDDLGQAPETGDLSSLAAQGVLLLNTALTVPEGDAGGHAKLGWDRLTRQVIARLEARPRAFLLWGKHAQAFAPQGEGHLVLQTAHPSPLSARRGFFGSRPFSRINDWLAAQGQSPILWAEVPRQGVLL